MGKNKTRLVKTYISTLVKNKEFIFIRFYDIDYENLNIRKVYSMLEPYIKEGWEIISIENIRNYIRED